jgi:hypothetical protein
MWHSLLAESARAPPVARARLERRGAERRGSTCARPAEFRSRRRAREVVLASSGHREVARSSADAASDAPAPHPRPRLVVPEVGRRAALVGASGALASALGRACGCGGCAWAMAPLVDADPNGSALYDVRRDATRDALFAEGMNTGMTGYEMAIADRKRVLFKRMLERLPRDEEATVVEVGMGTFPERGRVLQRVCVFRLRVARRRAGLDHPVRRATVRIDHHTKPPAAGYRGRRPERRHGEVRARGV